MTSFDERERAFENLFAHDQDLAFRAQARRNREIGLWAAQKLGRTGSDAEGYAAEVLSLAIAQGGVDPVVRKLEHDLAAGDVPVSEREIRRKMDEFLAEAVAQLKRE